MDVAARATGGGRREATYVPSPMRVSTRPSPRSCSYAPTTTFRRTPSCRERSLVDGRRERAGSRPPTIAARRLACTGAGPRFSNIVASGKSRIVDRRFKVVAKMPSRLALAPTNRACYKCPITTIHCQMRTSGMASDSAATYPVDAINRVKRRQDRGLYDHATVHELLDAAAMCHVSYVIDGQPFCTPTLFWREGTRLYWHGSNSSRMLRNLSEGEPACLTLTHFDSIVLARCGFNHPADYRSVMAFGLARLVADETEKARALVMMVDRFFPGRTAQL